MTDTIATSDLSPTVERFLDAIRSGLGIPPDLLAADATLDATVPNWRMKVVGRDAVAAEYGRWFHDPGAFEELWRSAVAGGEMVSYLLTWTEGGVPHAAHHCHILRLDDEGRIATDMCFCGGRWDAAMLADMAAAQQAG